MNPNSPVIEAGKLRDYVTIQQDTGDTRDASGRKTPNWQTFANAWVMIEPVSGGESQRADQTQPTVTYRVQMRYLAGVTEGMRISANGIYLNIASVRDVLNRRRKLVLDCKEAR